LILTDDQVADLEQGISTKQRIAEARGDVNHGVNWPLDHNVLFCEACFDHYCSWVVDKTAPGHTPNEGRILTPDMRQKRDELRMLARLQQQAEVK
jgi:hypothetical protein